MKDKSFLKAAVAVALLVAVVSSGVALGTDSFSDVPDGQFYTEAVAWAKANGMTTGSPGGSDTFKPLDGVTRAENITFAKRYDDFVVQPALDDRYTKAEVDAAIAAAGPKIYHAVVNADGTTRPGTTIGVTVTRIAGGVYAVEFPPDDIHECVYQATLVNELTTIGGGAVQPVLGPVPPVGQVTVAEDWDDNPFDPDGSDVRDPDSLRVDTDDSAGGNSDEPFHLTVYC